MSIIEAVFLGAVQGVTEFLPVSSSGHLVLFQKIFNIQNPALFFDTMLHLGSLAAVFAAMRKDIWAILKKLNQPLTGYLIVATVPTVVIALAFRKQLESFFETGKYLSVAFLSTSAMLIIAELLSKQARRSATKAANNTAPSPILKKANAMNWLDALVIGNMQAVSVIPGISRSGATLSGGLLCRLDRDFAARFSFLLSIPAILGAAVFQVMELVKNGDIPELAAIASAGSAAGAIGMTEILAGTLSAAITGFFAIRLMLKIVKKKPLWFFAIYTGLLGIFVLIYL
ncbi:MAG: undecaprenyl-diphosphate phosphatase [Treponema sp.]|nr:undecaprenyl-diphosphate phosphatase [Treponema sp.]